MALRQDCPVKELFQKFAAGVDASQSASKAEGAQGSTAAQGETPNLFFALFKWFGSFFGGK